MVLEVRCRLCALVRELIVSACTPCPIEVVYHQQETYVAVLTFSSREACEENVQDLLDYVEDHGDLHFTGDLQQTFRDVSAPVVRLINADHL